jgi:CheY-like chemotaxis protein/HPt (histidine-containing phosphotransfer) domain-containing protein
VRIDGNALRRSDLLQAVSDAAGLSSHHQRGDIADSWAQEQHCRPSVSQARAQGTLILVAEDDEINQQVLLRQLELIGYSAEVTGDGATALGQWRSGRYGLLLTDLHMPGMDGFALIAAIREEEDGLASSRIPILALTADAQSSACSRALAQGADEVLTKPLQLARFRNVLKQWLPRPGMDTLPAQITADAPATAIPSRAIDLHMLKSYLGEETDTVSQLLAVFQASSRRVLTDLVTAHAAQDVRSVRAIAHRFKSSSRAVGAQALADCCAELENLCVTGGRSEIARQVQLFRAACSRVDAEVSQLLDRSAQEASVRVTPTK